MTTELDRIKSLIESKTLTIEDFDKLLESMPKSANERYLRNSRLKPGDPIKPVNASPVKKVEATLQKVGDNDPTRTARGKASVQRQANKNKLTPEKFAEAIEFIASYKDRDVSEAISAVSTLQHKPELLKLIKRLRETGTDLRAEWVDGIESIL